MPLDFLDGSSSAELHLRCVRACFSRPISYGDAVSTKKTVVIRQLPALDLLLL